jgi:hypothetical protein
MTPIMTMGIIGMVVGAGASGLGASLQTDTIQVPGNPRIRWGLVMSFAGGLFLSVGGVSLALSIL